MFAEEGEGGDGEVTDAGRLTVAENGYLFY